MWRRYRFLLPGPLIPILALGIASPASAYISDPDPGDTGGEVTYVMLGAATAFNQFNIYPGRAATCVGPAAVSRFVSYKGDVKPNKGSPRAKVTVWRSTNSNPDNSVKIELFNHVGGGDDAFTRRYEVQGFYWICFKYPQGRAVDGSAFDFIYIGLSTTFE